MTQAKEKYSGDYLDFFCVYKKPDAVLRSVSSWQTASSYFNDMKKALLLQ